MWKTALVTGASAGIGKELARCFARDGVDVILVARREERLLELADELGGMGVTAHVVTCDLSKPDASKELVAELTERGLEVDVLVNNAGLGQYGDFARASHELVMNMVQVNVVALTQLTHLLLPGMLERGRGGVLMVGSTAGFQSGPGMAAYYATKAYVLSFTDALVEETRGTNVTVTNLSPGATYTEFQVLAEMEKSTLFAAGVATAEEVAKAGYRGLRRGDDLVVPGVKNKLTAFSSRIVPRALLRRVVRKINSDR